jgi:alpha-beta hydrolase superfamily lysophospholipase
MRRLKILAIVVCGVIVASAAVLAGMIAFGTGAPPKPLASIGDPFKKVDFSALPAVEQIPSRHASPIAFRHWDAASPSRPEPGTPERVVIAIHGSSASSSSLHPLAQALLAEGFTVYAPDIRGHGDTGTRGEIDYANELDDDLADLVAAVKQRHPNAELVLTGLSSGGGFALHAAATPLGTRFARVVLLSPFLGPRAPTVKQGEANAWAKVYLPRLIALAVLDRFGIHAFEHLPVVAFAVLPEQAKFLSPTYSFLLVRAFGTEDYAADLRNAKAPLAVVVGSNDELFDASRFAPTIEAIRPDTPVVIVPGPDHVGLALDPRAVPAIAAALRGDKAP